MVARTRRLRLLVASGLTALVLGALAPGAADARGPVAGASIIGGLPAAQEFSFTVAVYEGTFPVCTGSVVTPTVVVTAAHCVTGRAMNVSANRFKLGFPGGEWIPVAQAVRNPAYSVKTRANDVAVLVLSLPTTAPPIGLASAEEDAAYVFPGAVFSAAGFGDRNPLKRGKPKRGALMAADVRVAKGCGGLIPAVMICTRGLKFRRYLVTGTCFGDSGGPLAIRTSEGPRLFGVTSFGITPRDWIGKQVVCGHQKGREIFTRVAGVSGFIAPYL